MADFTAVTVYYIANQAYQFSYVKPIYHKIGGTFLATSRTKQIKIRWRLRHGLGLNDSHAPNIAIGKNNDLTEFEGVMISQSNFPIKGTKGKLTSIFMGHGTGDKKYGGNAEILKTYDYHFISGPKHLAKLADVKIKIPEDRLIKVGNPRFDDYLAGKIDRDAYLQRLGVREKERPMVLYAPTWQWGNGSLRSMLVPLARELRHSFNLIIRPHHFDIQLLPWFRLWAKLKGLRHVYFSNPDNLAFHDTMNDFAISDLLISDTSSVLYEYLITGKPIVQVQTENEDLHHMPDHLSINGKVDTIRADDTASIAGVVARNLSDQPYREEYRQLLRECFYLSAGGATNRAVEFVRSVNR